MSLSAAGGYEAHQLCPLMAWTGSDSTFCAECMDSDECHRRVSKSVPCPCCCADQATLGERLLEAWRVDALNFPYWEGGDAPLELFSIGSLGLLLGQEGDSCSHSGVLAGLALAGCLLGLFYGNFFVGWCCFTTSFLCISTPGGTLLPSQNDCEGPVYLLEKHLIPLRKNFKHFFQLTLVQHSLTLSHLKTLMVEWVSRCVGYGLQSSHVPGVLCGVWEGGRIVWRQKSEVDPGGLLGTWLSVPHSTLQLLPGLWGYWFGSCRRRSCITEHVSLPQPLQHKVQALGLEPPLSAVSGRCQAVEQGAGWLLSVDLAAVSGTVCQS
ncbi:PREDICTED: uncharacterized protein LOC106852964 [Sturnus vulgaris]|uniref:uncharacterized protein LOC106852964 n=1 Tax=Sturnus vulgaris TaxID=9172 RepID=UPI00071A774E|nr:PREDICTED: uncharacterized protein LOC106852964 [Sturnus vulgaris]